MGASHRELQRHASEQLGTQARTYQTHLIAQDRVLRASISFRRFLICTEAAVSSASHLLSVKVEFRRMTTPPASSSQFSPDESVITPPFNFSDLFSNAAVTSYNFKRFFPFISSLHIRLPARGRGGKRPCRCCADIYHEPVSKSRYQSPFPCPTEGRVTFSSPSHFTLPIAARFTHGLSERKSEYPPACVTNSNKYTWCQGPRQYFETWSRITSAPYLN